MPMRWEWKNLTDWLRKNLATTARQSSTPTGAITLKRTHLTYMRSLLPLLFGVLPSSRPAGRLLWVARRHTLTYILGGRPCWTIAPVPSTPAKSRSRSTTLRFATITVGALPRHSLYRRTSVLLGGILPEPAILITTACRIGQRTLRNSGQRCTSTHHAQCATTPKERD